MPGIFHENVFPPKEIEDDSEKENSSCINENENHINEEHSISQLASQEDIENANSVRRKKSSHSKGCCSFSNSKDIQLDDVTEDKVVRSKHEKSKASPFTKSRNNMRVMLSRLMVNNSNGRHERDT